MLPKFRMCRVSDSVHVQQNSMVDINKATMKILNSIFIINVRAIGMEVKQRKSIPELKQVMNYHEKRKIVTKIPSRKNPTNTSTKTSTNTRTSEIKRRGSAPCDLCYGPSCLLENKVKTHQKKIRKQHVAYLTRISRIERPAELVNFDFDDKLGGKLAYLDRKYSGKRANSARGKEAHKLGATNELEMLQLLVFGYKSHHKFEQSVIWIFIIESYRSIRCDKLTIYLA